MSITMPPEEKVKLSLYTLARLEIPHCKHVLDNLSSFRNNFHPELPTALAETLIQDVSQYLNRRISMYVNIHSYIQRKDPSMSKYVLKGLIEEVAQALVGLSETKGISFLFNIEINIRKSIWFDDFEGLYRRIEHLSGDSQSVQNIMDLVLLAGDSQSAQKIIELFFLIVPVFRHQYPHYNIPDNLEYSSLNDIGGDGIRLLNMFRDLS